MDEVCWYCQKGTATPEATYHRPMKRVIKVSYNEVTYERSFIPIPRCPQCFDLHQRSEKSFSLVVFPALLAGATVFGVLYKFTTLANSFWPALLVTWLIVFLFTKSKQRQYAASKIRFQFDVKDHPSVVAAVKQGWKDDPQYDPKQTSQMT